MAVEISRTQVQAASDKAVILLEKGCAYIVEREPDGGIIHPAASEQHQCYPISFLKEGYDEESLIIPAGDWVVIPYVKNNVDGQKLYGRDGSGFIVKWIN